jgi:aryl-alcohol dehydrogenase-like predicted oxidoreductase
MRYRMIGLDPETSREVSVMSLGAMLFGTATDEPTSFALLDRYVEAGGSFVDTSNNYAFWVNGTQGGESEELLGRWRRSRGIGGEVVIATKVGGRPLAPSTTFSRNIEGLSAHVIRASAERSRGRLGVEQLDLLYAHVEDRSVPLEETVEAFAGLVAEGTVGLIGVSNQWAWRVERARSIAATAGLPGYEVLQYHHTYLRQRTAGPPCARGASWAWSAATCSATCGPNQGSPWSPTHPCWVAPTSVVTSPWPPSSTTPVPRCARLRCSRWPARRERPPTRWSWPG